MIEKNCTITITELVVYPNPVLTIVKKVYLPKFDKLTELFDYIVKFDTTLHKWNLKFAVNKKNSLNEINEFESVYQSKLAIYSVTDSMETDVKRVSNIMKILN